jgi:FtsP/CotA-like multicopper oxidase with cupredoxin domain
VNPAIALRDLGKIFVRDEGVVHGKRYDVLAVPGRKTAEVEFVAVNPGPSLFHCHMQDHQDFGFMTLVAYR